MKNLMFLLIVIMFSIQCSAQSKIVNLTDRDGTRDADTYYKDIDKNLDPFVGTWVYTNGKISLKIVLKKEIKYYNGEYYEDFLIGEYQYIENGIEKINTIPQLNTIYSDQKNHEIYGNRILENQSRPQCDDCLPAEKRLGLHFYDPFKEKLSGKLFLRKTTVNGCSALKILKETILFPVYKDGDNVETEMIVPDGEYVLIKQ